MQRVISLGVLIAGLLLCLVFLTGCISEKPVSQAPVNADIHSDNASLSWTTTPMVEVSSGTTLTVLDLIKTGKPVIIHTFAVWCPACSMQLKETTHLLQNNPGNYSVLAIDIDPNENAGTVLNHVRKNLFAGNFVSAPASVSRDLVKTLGTGTTLSLPQTILVVNNTATRLGDGVFSEQKLKETIARLA